MYTCFPAQFRSLSVTKICCYRYVPGLCYYSLLNESIFNTNNMYIINYCQKHSATEVLGILWSRCVIWFETRFYNSFCLIASITVS